MLKNKIVFTLWILLISLFILTSVSASAENMTSDIYELDYSVNDSISIEVENVSSASPKTFSDLNSLINDNYNFNIYLTDSYKYDPSSDSQFVNGIVISKSVNIYGQGNTIDGNGLARIFNVTTYVNFKNINFCNANSQSGSAITGSNYAVSDSKFSYNHASNFGGALNGGSATNCIFESNSADRWGGAIYSGNVNNCTFISNSASEGGAIYNVYAINSLFTNNVADLYGGAMYGSSASDCIFSKNSAKSYAGAAFNVVYLFNCTFIGNTAEYAGAFGGGTGSADKCLFVSNTAQYGGAVYGCTVLNSVFRQNSASNGGAMYTGSVSNCLFEDNHATEVGGALMETYAANSNFTHNTAQKGGAMYQNSALECLFDSNSATNGGALFNAHAKRSTFIDNTATQGGAIDEGGAEYSTFKYNTAVNGGAVSATDVLSCEFLSNTAEEYGGAAYKSSARRCEFNENIAKYGAALASSSASDCDFVKNVAKITGGVQYDSYVADSDIVEGNLPGYHLIVSDFEGIQGFGGNINIQLYDSPDYKVTGVNATIKLYNSKNKLIGTYLSEVGYNWFIDLAAGSYKAAISIEDIIYDLDPVKININIKKSSFIYAADVTTNYQAGKVLIVNLHDADGKIIKYAKVSVNLNGATKTYLTDDLGQVMVPTKALAPKTYEAIITFAGDSTYLKSTVSAKITVNKLTPKLTAAKATLKLKDKTKKYTVTLKTNKNVVMKNTKITVKVNSKTYSAKTNAKGQAIFKLTKLTKKGSYSAVVTYVGSSIYNKVSKTVKITVK